MRNEHAPRPLDAPTWARASIALLAFASLVLSLALTRPDVGWHPHLVTAALLLSALVGVAIPRGWIERATSWALTLGLAALVVTVAALTGGLSSAALDLLPLLVVAAALAHGFHGSVLVGAVGVGAVSVFFVTAARAPSAALPELAALGLTHAAVLTLLALLAGVAARGEARRGRWRDAGRDRPARDETAAELVRLRARLRETARVEGELRAAVCLAESASSAKSQFLANMSHELRTPLNAIIGYSEMLLEDADEPDVATDLGRIRSSGRHLLALINDMLDLARVEAGRLELERSWFDVSELVNEVAAVMFPAADERGDMLVLDFAPDIGTLHADPVRVRQILLNLLSNAVKFTRDGTVTLRARRERRAGVEHVLFEIEDTGIGIAEHQQSRLFRPFVQAHSGVSGQYGGTGLGLALSARFAEMMEGEIGVRSELGVGSTFTFSLPVNSTSARMEDLFESRVAEAAESERPVVLCVDSDTTALDLLCRALSAEGYHPVPVRQGDAVVELARRLAPVAVTLDTGAAGIDGWATLATLRGDPSTRATPVIAISTDHDAARCLARGAREFVGKPVRRELLRDALARCRGVEPQRASA